MIKIFAIFVTIVFANSQEKYIDVLPYEKKQEFIDNVARRVMETVEGDGTNKENIELADEQLKKHNSYVQSVIEQKAAVVRARRIKKNDRLSEKDNKSKENDDLEVKPFQFHEDDVDKLGSSEADNKDFAMTGMNRRSYDEIPQDNFADTFEMDDVMQHTLPLQGRPITRDVISEETIKAFTIKNSNEEKVNANNQEAFTLNSEMHIHKSNLEDSTTETEDSKIETTNNLATALKNISKFETSSVTSFLHEIVNISTETPTGSKIQILEYGSATNSNPIYLITEKNEYLVNNFVPSLNATESYTLYDSYTTLTSFLTDKTTVDPVINTATNESSDITTVINSQVFTTTTQNTAEVNTAKTENYSMVTEDRSAKDTITKTTTLTPILTSSNNKEEQSTKKPKKIKLSKTIKQLENDRLVNYIVSKALNNIKHELELKKKGKFMDNAIETNKGNIHLNHYQVYEIPWPINGDHQPFHRSQETIKDQPYFVPVHKYSQNIRYYNLKKGLGPNEVKENSIELDIRHLCEGNNDVHDKTEPSEFILQLNNEMRKFTYLHKRTTTTTPQIPLWDILFNPLEDINKKLLKITSSPKNKHLESTVKETSNIEWNILGVRKEKDLFIKQGFQLPSLMRSKVESKVNIYMNVLKALILEDSKSLKQYDWLTTTVQIQSALSKILKLINRMRQLEQLYPADLQILRYLVFLYNFSLEVKQENHKLSDKLKKRVKVLRNNTLLKEEKLIKREDDGLSQLYEFLIDVQDGLFDLHEAIRHIADVTKFDRQNWYGNLKQLYLSADEKHLRELLLHISMSRLVDLVDHSYKHSQDHDFVQFVKSNKKDAKRIVEEMIFINNIVHEITINRR